MPSTFLLTCFCACDSMSEDFLSADLQPEVTQAHFKDLLDQSAKPDLDGTSDLSRQLERFHELYSNRQDRLIGRSHAGAKLGLNLASPFRIKLTVTARPAGVTVCPVKV